MLSQELSPHRGQIIGLAAYLNFRFAARDFLSEVLAYKLRIRVVLRDGPDIGIVRFNKDVEIILTEYMTIKEMITVPDWFAKIKRNASKQRFWVGDDYIVSYFWNPEIGQVVESMDDRRNGLNAVDRYKSKELGSDEAAVLAQIQLRLGEKEAKIAAKTSILNAYDEYVLDRQKRSLPVKSFEKWAAK